MKNKLIQFQEDQEEENYRCNPEILIRASNRKIRIQLSSSSSQSEQQAPFFQLTHSLQQIPYKQNSNSLCHSIQPIKTCKKIETCYSQSEIKRKHCKITTIGQLDDNFQQVIYLGKKTEKQTNKQTQQTQKRLQNLNITDLSAQKSVKVRCKRSNVFDIVLDSQLSSESFHDEQTGGQQQIQSNKDDNQQEYSQTQTNILNPSQKTIKKCNQVIDYFMGIRNKQTFNNFLQRAIIDNMVYQFQIIQNKKLFQNSYEFYICYRDSKHMIMFAKNHEIANLKYMYMDLLIDFLGDVHRIGRIRSDFKRNNFEILDGGNYPENKIYGHFQYSKNFIQKKANLYIPKTHDDSNQLIPFYTNPISNLLGQLSNIEIHKKNILELKSSQITFQWDILSNKYNMEKSKRNLLMRDQQMNQLKLIFGKITNNRFKVICGSRITPLLAFAVGVVVLQIS